MTNFVETAIADVESALGRALDFNPSKIDAFFATATTDIEGALSLVSYVTGWFGSQGALLSSVAAVLASLVAPADAALAAEITADWKAFQNWLSGLNQAAQQGSPAQSAAGASPQIAVLQEGRRRWLKLQGSLNAARAKHVA